MGSNTQTDKEVRTMGGVYINDRSIMLSDDVTEENVGLIMNAIINLRDIMKLARQQKGQEFHDKKVTIMSEKIQKFRLSLP